MQLLSLHRHPAANWQVLYPQFHSETQHRSSIHSTRCCSQWVWQHSKDVETNTEMLTFSPQTSCSTSKLCNGPAQMTRTKQNMIWWRMYYNLPGHGPCRTKYSSQRLAITEMVAYSTLCLILINREKEIFSPIKVPFPLQCDLNCHYRHWFYHIQAR